MGHPVMREWVVGGNALKSVKTCRLPADQYHPLSQRVCQALSERFDCRAAPIPAFRSKEDFGDLDVVIEKEHASRERLEDFARTFGHARQIVVNGPVLSYDHRSTPSDETGFQVDLIRTPSQEFDVSLAYFSYNDLGNLIGRIAHKMGFSYGHRGLLYPMRDGTHLIGTVHMSSDFEQCLGFLGYNASRFREGFEGREEIYEYVVSSPYFNPSIYLLENRNHTSRTRDRKRPTYMGFLEYLRSLPAQEYFRFPEEKSAWLPKAFEEFEGFEARVGEVLSRHALSARVKEAFNGKIMAERTGLSGKALGAFMANARAHLGGLEGMAALLDEGGVQLLQDRALTILHSPTSAAPPKIR